jgi:hypothetical protein
MQLMRGDLLSLCLEVCACATYGEFMSLRGQVVSARATCAHQRERKNVVIKSNGELWDRLGV